MTIVCTQVRDATDVTLSGVAMRRFWLWILFACGICVSARGEPGAAAPGSLPSVSDVIVQGLERPLRLRLVCLSGGRPWREHFDEAQSRYVKALFAQLDADGNGKLSPGEATRLPAPRMAGGRRSGEEVNVAFNFRVLDTDGDGGASAAELDSYLAAFGDSPLRLFPVSGESSADFLFRALDADGDRVLTVAEASQVERLFERDRDANRVLTVDELRGPTGGQLPPEFIASPAGQALPRGPLRLRLEGTPGKLDGEAVLDLQVEFANDDGGRPATPKVTIGVGSEAERLGLSAEKNDRGEYVLKCGRRLIVVRVLSPVARRTAADRQALEQEFAALAERANGDVAASADMTPALRQIFLLADRNADQRLDVVELRGCLDRLFLADAAAKAGRLRIVAFAEQSGLLPLVDLNCDGRLSRRELQGVSALVKSLAGKEGRLTPDDLPLTTLLVLQRGPFSDAPEKDVLREAGPAWFARADRNADGDLDREEFLGTPEDFDRLDLNRDGWIDLEEALRADVSSPAAPKDPTQGGSP